MVDASILPENVESTPADIGTRRRRRLPVDQATHSAQAARTAHT